jgi:membrane-associated phospholipid phosphatase
MIGRWAVLLAAALGTVPAWTQEAAPAPSGYQIDEIRHLPGLLWDDTKTLARLPGDWTRSQWTEAGLGLAAVAATGLLLDRTVDDAVQRSDHPAWRNAAKNVAQLGGVGGLVLIGAGYLGSSALGQDEARALWTDTGIATVLARATAFTVQVAVGRDTPSANQGPHDFRPFSSQDSFPSGHASQAFAMASAISMHADSPWVGGVAYGLAGLVGLARMETRDHYASDVVAGALVGTTIGRAVVRVNQGRREGTGPRAEFSVVPAWGRDYRGICLAAKF